MSLLFTSFVKYSACIESAIMDHNTENCCGEEVSPRSLHCITAGLFRVSSFDPSMVQPKSANDY